MNTRLRTCASCFLLVLCLSVATPLALAAAPDRWVGTWGASPVPTPNTNGRVVSGDTTLREIVHISLGGSIVRVVLSNEFGLDPLTIGAAGIALSAADGGIIPSSSAILTFGGHPSAIIPPGALLVSDPVTVKLPAFADVAVSLFIPDQPIQQLSGHSFADQTNYSAVGNVVGAEKLDTPQTYFSWPILKGIDIKGSAESGAIVTFGDSITDGALSTRNANVRWPDVLARRLQANKRPPTSALSTRALAAIAYYTMSVAPVHWPVSTAMSSRRPV